MIKQPGQVFFICVVLMVWCSRPGYAKDKITFTAKDSIQRQAKAAPCEIQVFQDAKPERTYVDIGIINYHDERHRANAGSLKLEAVMPKIKALACKVGADALIDIKVTEVRRLEIAMFNVRVTAVRFEPE